MKRKQLLISTTAALTLSVLLSLPTVYGCITTSHNKPCMASPQSVLFPAREGGEVDEELFMRDMAKTWKDLDKSSDAEAWEKAAKSWENLKIGRSGPVCPDRLHQKTYNRVIIQ